MAASYGGSKRVSMNRRARRFSFELLEPRQLLSLSHFYTFNDGLANDWVGNAHATLFNGASIVDGQLVLANTGVTSGQTSTVQYARLPSDVLSSGDATVEFWFTAMDLPDGSRVFDFGNQSGSDGDSYLFFTPHSLDGDSRGVLSSGGIANERIAGSPTTDDGTEHMAAIVVDTGADLLRLYIDGNEVSSASLAGDNAGSVDDTLAYLGRSLFNADPGFTGSINELRIFDHAVTPTEVAAHAELGPSTAERSPLRRRMEVLDRGLVVVRSATSQAYVGWRLFATDPGDIAFNVYRSADGGDPVKLNATPITNSTNFVDTGANFGVSNEYFVRPVVDDFELAPSETFTLWNQATNSSIPVQQYINVPIDRPAGGETPDGNYTYSANDASVGDLDGDGDFEIILKWDPSNAKDNSQSGYTGNVYIDAYDFDGNNNSTLLWRIDLGRNMRAGAHYNQFLVYDLDGDGKAEVVMRTAEATIDGVGTVIGDRTADYRNSAGYILSGPEFLTVFDGQTGAIIDSIPFEPVRGSVASWGDTYGNRVDRFQATIAYLDGVHPSLVWGRGYAGPQSGLNARNEVAAYDYVNGQLEVRWVYKAATNGQDPGYVGSSAHSITVGDVDGDGKDEVTTGAAAIDDDGTLLYNTGLGHGDALHLSDLIPSRPGLELFMPHESPGSYGDNGADVRDARTGEIIFGIPATNDVGRGVAGDIDPNSPGYEVWATVSGAGTRTVYSAEGQPLYRTDAGTPTNNDDDIPFNFLVWWDADPIRELLDGTRISKWRYDVATPFRQTILSLSGTSSNNGSKSTPSLSGDILGDWREEVIMRASNNAALRIYTTTIVADSRLYTLLQDPQYRQAIAWQNSGYNQPPHPGFFLGAGMADPPKPQSFVNAGPPGDYNGNGSVGPEDYVTWRMSLGSMSDLRADGDHDGIIGQGDYQVWRDNFGAVPAPAAGGGSSLSSLAEQRVASPVPESFALAFDTLQAPSRTARVSFTARDDTHFVPAVRDDLLLVAQYRAPIRPSVESPSNSSGPNAEATRSADAFDAAFASFDRLIASAL